MKQVMKATKFFAATFFAAVIAISASGKDRQNIIVVDSIEYEQIEIPRYKEVAFHRPFFYYINDEWIPGWNHLDEIDPKDISSITIIEDKYGNRGVQINASDEILQKIKDKAKEINMAQYPDEGATWMFPGGNWRLHYWLEDNVKKPEGFDEESTAYATVGFKLSLNGLVSEAKILNSTGQEELDAEALRVVNSLPRFVVEVHRPDVPPSYSFHLSLPISFIGSKVIFIR